MRHSRLSFPRVMTGLGLTALGAWLALPMRAQGVVGNALRLRRAALEI